MRVMEQVPIRRLKFYPGNPRRGNVDMIADSLQTNGQYRPVLVHRETGWILAGNHTVRAARQLGWRQVTVEYTDCTRQEAQQIMLADNRASDAGYTDHAAAYAILATLPTLEGTGYTQEDLDLPEVPVGDWEPVSDGEEQTPTQDRAGAQEGTQPLRLGRVRGQVQGAEYDRWRKELPKGQREAADIMLTRLGLLEEISQPAAQPDTMAGSSFALIRDLQPYPGNPRQGDIGLIMGLLRAHGQYRPVVVNRRNSRILAGNHVVEGIRQLGWERARVVWVDTDEAGEKRILLADNRTADLASYDMEDLGRAVAGLGPEGLAGTGFTLTELDDIIAGKQPKETTRTAGDWVQVGAVKAKIRGGLLAGAGFTEGQELMEAAYMLGIDPAKISQGGPEQNHQT